MANDFRIDDELRNAACQGYGDVLAGGDIEIKSGAPPATLGDPAGGTVLATCVFTTFGPPSNGTIAAAAITPDTDSAGGDDAGHFIVRQGGVAKCQGTCGDSNDAPVDMLFTQSKTIVAGGTTSVTTFVITQPE